MKTSLNTFVVADPSKCIGCKVCEVACSVAHSDRKTLTAGYVDSPLITKLYLVKTADVTMPIQCRHCEDAPCANVCPVAAITRQNDKILVNEADCIGCKTCMIACPFGAISLTPVYRDGKAVVQNLWEKSSGKLTVKERLVANKCDLCDGRTEGPACVGACPEKALNVIVAAQEKKNRNIEAAKSLLKLSDLSK